MDASNLELAVYGAIGVYAVKEFFVPLVRGSFARNLQAKDEQDRTTAAKIEAHDKRLQALELSHGNTEVKMAASSSSISSELGAIKGRLDALDTRIEKSGKEHDERLSKGLADVAVELNRKLSHTLNAELERTVREVLREELRARATQP